jgi:hypothetical protein
MCTPPTDACSQSVASSPQPLTSVVAVWGRETSSAPRVAKAHLSASSQRQVPRPLGA